MARLEGSLHGLKADPSARTDDQDCRHGDILPVDPLTLICDGGSRTASGLGQCLEIKTSRFQIIIRSDVSYRGSRNVAVGPNSTLLTPSGLALKGNISPVQSRSKILWRRP